MEELNIKVDWHLRELLDVYDELDAGIRAVSYLYNRINENDDADFYLETRDSLRKMSLELAEAIISIIKHIISKAEKNNH